ncbi:hypothetical protein ACGF12_34345 [Kitasatospora sp. NPDC048296]|uniref:hypothetical protein n=1 Tax=Kitasatospora sp. NPDC048296 TaxID=3364048 RepID=UPI003716B577
MPFNPNRAQSGMYDSHGDGHPPREAYLPAHSGYEKAPETAYGTSIGKAGPAAPENPQTAA